MNENYLWDKTGDDAEIEQLENALQAFRYQETAAPAILAKNIPFKTKSNFSFFSLRFAVAMCAILAIIGAGIWSFIYVEKLNIATDSAKIIAPISAPVIQKSPTENPNVSISENSKSFARQKD